MGGENLYQEIKISGKLTYIFSINKIFITKLTEDGLG